MSVASDTIAVKRDRKEADGTYATDFFDIYMFGKQAEYAAKYLRKGDKVCVSGSVHIRDYTTKNGVKGRAVEIAVNSIENLSPKSEDNDAKAEEEAANVAAESQNLDSIDIPDDDLPF